MEGMGRKQIVSSNAELEVTALLQSKLLCTLGQMGVFDLSENIQSVQCTTVQYYTLLCELVL